jgi:hypothetical protein
VVEAASLNAALRRFRFAAFAAFAAFADSLGKRQHCRPMDVRLGHLLVWCCG